MKKILLGTLIMLICVSGGVAQAMQPQTKDITRKLLYITDGFYKPIEGANLEMCKTAHSECRTAYDTLFDYLEANKPKTDEHGYVMEFLSYEDRTVVYNAANVIVTRIYALSDYIIALEAHKNGDIARHKTMIDACSYDLQLAADLRQAFINQYGY